jgi:hypothetical protein
MFAKCILIQIKNGKVYKPNYFIFGHNKHWEGTMAHKFKTLVQVTSGSYETNAFTHYLLQTKSGGIY